MDVMVWLRSLGLGKYEAAFRENDIDETVLPGLTPRTLKDLGVASVGHRLKLLDAIAALRTDAGVTGPSAAAGSTVAPSVSPEDRAERRQVTVMFSDLVGSTALSARMDPEDLREVISAYQKCVAETVQRFGGFVAKYMGDGVLIYFGYPQAHEDDAERAVRAGLDLVTAVSGLKTHAALQTRVGIATGLVVVGDLIGAGASQEQAIVGETPNLAARLQGVAEPNSVVIAESTRKLVGNLFEFQDLEAQDLKGMAGPVRAWAALRPASVESRFDALHASGLTELVGREEELELLLRRWSKAKSWRRPSGVALWRTGHWQVSTDGCTSRTRSLLSHIRDCATSARRSTPTAPCIQSLARWSARPGLRTTTTRKQSSTSSMPYWHRPLRHARTRRSLLRCCRCRTMDAILTLELTPQRRRQRTLEALTAQVEVLSRSNPVLMIFEDATLDRPDEPRSTWSDGGPAENTRSAASHHVSDRNSSRRGLDDLMSPL